MFNLVPFPREMHRSSFQSVSTAISKAPENNRKNPENAKQGAQKGHLWLLRAPTCSAWRVLPRTERPPALAHGLVAKSHPRQTQRGLLCWSTCLTLHLANPTSVSVLLG